MSAAMTDREAVIMPTEGQSSSTAAATRPQVADTDNAYPATFGSDRAKNWPYSSKICKKFLLVLINS